MPERVSTERTGLSDRVTACGFVHGCHGPQDGLSESLRLGNENPIPVPAGIPADAVRGGNSGEKVIDGLPASRAWMPGLSHQGIS